MAQTIISLGATTKNLCSINKNEAKNYIKEIEKPSLIISNSSSYKDDSDFTFLSYQLVDNLKLPNLICVDKLNIPLTQVVKAVLSKLNEGLIIIDLPPKEKECDEIITLLENNKNEKINVLLNLPKLQFCKENLHKIHTGWRVFNSIKKADYEYLLDNIGKLDATGLLITGALRDEYVKTYKLWCKKEKKKTDTNIVNIPFYYHLSTININKDVFNELINPVIENLKLFEIDYDSNEIKEMYL